MITNHEQLLDDLCSRFVDWLEQQDPQTTFRYIDNKDCVFSRFLKDAGYPDNVVFSTGVHLATPVFNPSPIFTQNYRAIDRAIAGAYRACRGPVMYGVVLEAIKEKGL